jgi:hypothetical protein
MPNTPYTMEQSIFFPSSITEGKRQQQRVPTRRGSRITLGFWLGGILFGTAGCILGASLSYSHPVARIISVVWWGIYFGCLGASIGALPGLFLGGIRTRCSREPERAARPPSKVAREDRARPKQRADSPVS